MLPARGQNNQTEHFFSFISSIIVDLFDKSLHRNPQPSLLVLKEIKIGKLMMADLLLKVYFIKDFFDFLLLLLFSLVYLPSPSYPLAQTKTLKISPSHKLFKKCSLSFLRTWYILTSEEFNCNFMPDSYLCFLYNQEVNQIKLKKMRNSIILSRKKFNDLKFFAQVSACDQNKFQQLQID